jgi:hypothetical protein
MASPRMTYQQRADLSCPDDLSHDVVAVSCAGGQG